MILLFTLGAALCFALGNLLQKIALNRVKKTFPDLEGTSFGLRTLTQHNWWGGIALSTMGTAGYYYAAARWNLSLVQPLMCLNPVLTALLGFSVLKEHLDRRTLLSLILVIMGILLLSFHLDEVGGKPGTMLWPFAGVVLLLTIITMSLFQTHKEVSFTLASGLGFGLSTILWKTVAMEVEDPWTLLVLPHSYAFVLAYSFGFFMNQRALARGRVLFVIPFSAAIGTLLPVAGGFIVFGEPLSLLKFVSVTIILMGTLLFLTTPPPRHAKNPEAAM